VAEAATVKEGWTLVKFGDVVQQCKEKVDPETSGLERYVAGDHMDTDDVHLRRWGAIGDGYLGPAFHMRFRPGQVLYGSRRTYLRKVAVADFDGVCANTTFVLEPRGAKLIPELLPFIMQSEPFVRHSVKQSRGSVNPYVNFSDLAWYEFPLPPLDQQRRIADALWALERSLETTREMQASVQRLRTALIEETIEALGTRFSRFPLREFLDDVSYGCSKRAGYHSSGVPILRIPNVLRGEIDLSDLKRVELNDKELDRFAVEYGDLLMVRTNGNPDYVGRCVVAEGLPEQTVYASYLIRLRVRPQMLRPGYLAAVINSPSSRRKLRADVRSSAGNYNINAEGIRRQEIVMPDLESQDVLLARLNELEAARRSLLSRGNQTLAFKNRLLQEVSQ